MGTAIAVRTDFSSQKLRRLATRVKDAAQARRLLAIAAVLDSAARERGGEDRRHGSADPAGLGDPVQRSGAGRPDQQMVGEILRVTVSVCRRGRRQFQHAASEIGKIDNIAPKPPEFDPVTA
jgi:hypothetical protein